MHQGRGKLIRTLLIATHNEGKLREFRSLLAGLSLHLTGLRDQNIHIGLPEEGETFEANALAKAEGYLRLSGLPTLADDSGLTVAALDGAPGVRSARFAGEGASDADRVAELLRQLASVPSGQRQARFICAIAIALPGGKSRVVGGQFEGEITLAPRGSHGFGYDPVFLVPELGRTFAELEPDEKNRISHRARAGAAARAALLDLFPDIST
ncbi:MAG: RdgB/HAM1 family non-canonical purine NTP pyrophosphatase [Chloroflexota bacterium]